MKIDIKIDLNRCFYDEFIPIRELYVIEKIKDLEKVESILYDKLRESLPEEIKKLDNKSIKDWLLKQKEDDKETGKFDIDIIATGINHIQHEQMCKIVDIIQKLSNETKNNLAIRDNIIREAEIEGLEPSKVEEAIERLKRNGQIYEPEKNKYKTTEY